jgi:hypothetical protein
MLCQKTCEVPFGITAIWSAPAAGLLVAPPLVPCCRRRAAPLQASETARTASTRVSGLLHA